MKNFHNCGNPVVIFFHPAQKADNLPLRLPKLEINNTTIEREPEMKFLGVLIDENLSWKCHINTVKNKIAKHLGLLYKARYIVNNNCLKELYFPIFTVMSAMLISLGEALTNRN